jgi:predicted KAP-like P-loop ATPase
MVIGVHGDWGEGKTSFMRVLQALLGKEQRQSYRQIEQRDSMPKPWLSERAEKELKADKSISDDILTVWFNPWEHQFEDEPVMPLLDAIRHQHASRWSKVKSNLKRAIEDPKFRIIGKAALGVVKMAGPGWFSALSRQIGDEARKVMDSFADFRKEFEQCMDELTKDSGGRVAVFVDDLDRCEADYVVKILESLKLHLLNRHCVFVLGCAETRVRSCLSRKMELTDEEAREYVEKIVQLPVHLPHMWDANFRKLLEHLGWSDFAADEDCFNLLRAFAGDNPRRLKRFLHWYEMERAMVDFVPNLRDRAAMFFINGEALFLKVKLLQFVDPRGFVQPEHFDRDSGPPEYLPE